MGAFFFPPWWHWFNSNKHRYLCEKSMYQLRGFCTWVSIQSAILKLIRKSVAFTWHSPSHWQSGTWSTGEKNLSSWLLGEEKEKLEYKSTVKIFRGAVWGTRFYLGWISLLTRQGVRVRAAENKDNGLGYHALTHLSLSIEPSVEWVGEYPQLLVSSWWWASFNNLAFLRTAWRTSICLAYVRVLTGPSVPRGLETIENKSTRQLTAAPEDLW